MYLQILLSGSARNFSHRLTFSTNVSTVLWNCWIHYIFCGIVKRLNAYCIESIPQIRCIQCVCTMVVWNLDERFYVIRTIKNELVICYSFPFVEICLDNYNMLCWKFRPISSSNSECSEIMGIAFKKVHAHTRILTNICFKILTNSIFVKCCLLVFFMTDKEC